MSSTPAPPPGPASSARTVVLVFVAVIGSFVVSTLVLRRTSSEVEALSAVLVDETAPGIQALSVARRDVVDVERTLGRLVYAPDPSRSPAAARLDGEVRDLERSVEGYLAIPLAPGEEPYWREVDRDWVRFDAAVRRTRELVEAGDEARAQVTYADQVEESGQETLDALSRAIAFNVDQTATLAAEILENRRRTSWVASALTGVCTLLGVVGAATIVREDRARRKLHDAWSRFQADRAEELEQFAGRVAHDIRNPLGAALLGAQLIVRKPEDAPAVADRVVQSLRAAQSVVDGLLEFARAGARPDPGARVEVGEVIEVLRGTLEADGSLQDLTLGIEAPAGVSVACSRGVYHSLLSNLVRNAIKYMGEGDGPRRVDVRVTVAAGAVRTEVADTGPGIPEDAQAAVFEPYVRAHTGPVGGLGLGLATVKKLAEAHRGSVGLTSAPGRGSTFWFVLPQAPTG